jgi:hypothetical protein
MVWQYDGSRSRSFPTSSKELEGLTRRRLGRQLRRRFIFIVCVQVPSLSLMGFVFADKAVLPSIVSYCWTMLK